MYLVTISSPVSRRLRPPSWFDLRLVGGVVLVLVSLLVGIKVVGAADHTQRVWAAAHDLAPGTILQSADLKSVPARLPDGAGSYFSASTPVIGQTVNRQTRAGELLPRSAVGDTPSGNVMVIPLGDDSAPKIAQGQRIDVWVSTTRCPTALVLSAVTVQGVQPTHSGSFAAGGGVDIAVQVNGDQAQRVIAALALSAGVLRAVLVNQPSTQPVLPDLGSCAAPIS